MVQRDEDILSKHSSYFSRKQDRPYKLNYSVDKKSTERKYELADKLKIPMYLVSAADGTNVVKVF
jgi:hypothetical protein